MILKNDCVSKNEKLMQRPFLCSKRVSVCRKAPGLLGSIILMMAVGLGTAWAEKLPEGTQQKLKGLRIPFVVNQGQMDRKVKFYAKTFSGTVYVTDLGRMVYQLPPMKDRNNQSWVLVEETLDGLPVKEIKGEKESETRVNYFLGKDQTKWKDDIPTYEAVDLGEVYKGIALKLRAYGGSVEKLYYVGPGRKPKEIRIKVKGAESLKVNDKGELEAQTGNGPVVFSRPRAFQQQGGQQKDIEIAYLIEKDSYGFKVGTYDNTKELIIDPLIQSTYLGRGGGEWAYSMAVSGGNVYVAGMTTSTDFPGTAGGAQPVYGGGSYDAFVSRLSSDLKTLTRTTYLGGTGDDRAYAMAVSGTNVYVAGATNSTDFPETGSSAQPVYGGGLTDTFVSRLTNDLTSLVESTYLGGGDTDRVYSLAVSEGNVYVAGTTASTDFPGTAGGAQPVYGGGITGGGTDVFISILSGTLKQIIQSTYLGLTAEDGAHSIAISGEYVYVAGETHKYSSEDFPGTAGGAQSVFGGGHNDAFVSQLTVDLTQLVQSTYLGGGGNDLANSIAVSGGDVYVAGTTTSAFFPGTGGGAQPGYSGEDDAFVSRLSSDLKTLNRSTYLGGTGNDQSHSIAVSGENVYVAGTTASTDIPGTGGGVQPVFGGGSFDAFVSLLTADLTQRTQSTYLGGISMDGCESLVVSGGNVYVAGVTYSTDFPGTIGGYQPVFGGDSNTGADAYVSLLSGDLKAQTPVVFTGTATGVTGHSATVNGTVNPKGYSTTYYFDWGTTTAYGNKSPVTPASAGSGWSNVAVSANLTGLTQNTTYHYRLVATNSIGTTYGLDMTFEASIKAMPWLMLLLVN